MASRRTKKDIAVEQALYGKAVGVYITQQEAAKCRHIEYTDTGKKLREDETLEVREVQKYCPPEMAAIAMWLKARRPEVWGDSAPTVGTPVRIVDDVPAQSGGVSLRSDAFAPQETATPSQSGGYADNVLATAGEPAPTEVSSKPQSGGYADDSPALSGNFAPQEVISKPREIISVPQEKSNVQRETSNVSQYGGYADNVLATAGEPAPTEVSSKPQSGGVSLRSDAFAPQTVAPLPQYGGKCAAPCAAPAPCIAHGA